MLGIHPASVQEVPLLLEMILEFATFEKLREEVTITEAMLARDGFGAHPRFRTLLAEWDRAAAGYAINFPIYSTFQGPALFLEDVYVRPQFRDKLAERVGFEPRLSNKINRLGGANGTSNLHNSTKTMNSTLYWTLNGR
jgi:hypothetical protein